jgi:hypothetical protein
VLHELSSSDPVPSCILSQGSLSPSLFVEPHSSDPQVFHTGHWDLSRIPGCSCTSGFCSWGSSEWEAEREPQVLMISFYHSKVMSFSVRNNHVPHCHMSWSKPHLLLSYFIVGSSNRLCGPALKVQRLALLETASFSNILNGFKNQGRKKVERLGVPPGVKHQEPGFFC